MKRLMKVKEGKLLGGVCGGIGKYYEVDPVIVRIVWVVLTLLSVGIGIIAYIVAWLLMPEEGEDAERADTPAS